MTAYDFSLVKNTSFAFDAEGGDTLNFGTIEAASLSVTESGGNLIITSGSDSVTLQGASAAQVTTTNMTFGSATDASVWAVGDNSTGTTFDASGNALDIDGAPSVAGVTAAQTDANHLLYGFGGGDTIVTGNGNSVIFGGTGIVDSVDGNDTITVGTGANTIYGNAGNDTVSFGAIASGLTTSIFGGLGDDIIQNNGAAAVGNGMFYGNTGDDVINLVNGGTFAGDATIYGGNGIADANSGDDTITVNTGNATIYANSGTDTIVVGATASGKTANIYAGTGNDTITASGASGSSTVIFGGDADADSITFNGAGDATIYGGLGIASANDGNDTITLGTGSSLVYANAGTDTISLTGAMVVGKSAVIHTGAGNDTVNVSANTGDGNDITLYSNAGDDTFNLNNNANAGEEYDFALADFATGDIVNATLDGGGAATALTVSGGGSSLTLTDANGSFVFSGYSGDLNATNFVISDGSRLITNFSGTAATLTGSTGADHLVSGDSDDTLISGGGADKLVGGAGNDTFQVDATTAAALQGAAFTISGGAGTDILEITTAAVTMDDNDFDTDGTPAITSVETVKLANFTGNSITLGTDAALAGIVSVDGSASTGTATNTVILDGANYGTGAFGFTGGAGVDSFNAGTNAGNHTVSTAAGNDLITLAGGNDSIDAGADSDTITIATANLDASDTITGGAGTDKIIISDAVSLVDTDFTNVTLVEELEMGAVGTGSVTLASQAAEAGLATVDGGITTGALTVDAGSFGNALSIIGGSAADVITGSAGATTIRINAVNDTIANDQITISGSNNTIQVEVGEEDATEDFTDGNVPDITGFTFGNGGDVFDFTDLSVADLNGTGVSIQVADGSTNLAENVGLFVATNQFAGATEANIVAGLTGDGTNITAAEVFYVLFSNGTNAYLIEVTEDGGDGVDDTNDTFTHIAEFVGVSHTDLANATAANFADFS